ncbi:MAG: hypothetical protein KUG82_06095 [Pseudomonadales bacterium]|nr:hypothetical protein [Pseudomonadales bacterium]
MASKPSNTRPSTPKKSPSTETSLSIRDQTQAFLESGGEIEYINSGVSGQQSLAGPKHITLGNSNSRPQQPQAPAKPEAIQRQAPQPEPV